MYLVTALRFYIIFGSLDSLLNLEQNPEMVTAIIVEVFLGCCKPNRSTLENGEKR